MKNYRPIKLLNVDQKIITKILTTRASPSMPHLVHTDQTSAIKGRTIQEHNHFIRDIITLAHDKQIQATILSLDQTKAFDQVSHSYLHKTLEHCNFGPYFRKWIQILYKEPTSQILTNHTLSEPYSIGRGLMQGDSLSPLLYVLTLEPLLEKIRQDKRIAGIKIPGGNEQKLKAFADDTNFFITQIKSIGIIQEHFRHFGKGSGSSINETKSQALKIGKWKSKANDPFRIQWVKEIKIFGITYSNTRDQSNREQWEQIKTKTKQMLDFLFYKETSIFGRSILVNTLIFPKIIYYTQTLDAPTDIIKQINGYIRQFIFKGTISNISHSTLIQNKVTGGINLQDIESKSKTFRLQYIRKIIENRELFTLAHYYIGTKLTKLDNSKPHYTDTLPSFYETCIRTLKTHENILLTNRLSTTKTIYQAIIGTLAKPLHTQIQRATQYGITDFRPTFKNLHITCTTAIQKQVTYRILFSNTPTSLGHARQINRVIPCTICRYNIQETEEHIYYQCANIQLTKQSLTKLLTPNHNTPLDTYKAIFLNIIPNETRDFHLIKLHVLAIYRETIWKIRLDTKFNDKRHTPQTIHDLFTYKLIHALTKQNQWQTFEQMLE